MKVLKALLVLTVLFNSYFTFKTVKFAKASEEYFAYLQLKTDCLEQQAGMDQNDIFLAAQGKTRSDITDSKIKEFLPVRRVYDTQNEKCRAYAKYMCWYLDPTDDEMVDRCGPGFGYSAEEIAEVKRTHSLDVIKNRDN